MQNGFLSKKSVIVAKSSCDDVLAGENCWIAPTYKRAVLVLVDALRYDFVNKTGPEDQLFMEETMNILSSDREHARLYRFIADAPTTTMQRITALMTGSFPAFIEAGSNFAAVQVEEDNLLYQLKSLNKTITFYGDDTWAQLFPDAFSHSVGMDSFNVKDLDTVDTAVRQLLFNKSSNSNSTLLIAHFLGVDHCGHRYGPEHAEMKRKLKEMDDVIRRLVDAIDDDTILFVFGDHGMNKNGDHGGDTTLETTAGLIVYSPKGFHGEYTDTVRQIDMVPTLSLLLDVPIPFSSLGIVMKEFFEMSVLPKVASINVRQVVRYVDQYMRGNPEVERAAKKTIMYHEQTSGAASDGADFETIEELRDLVIHSMNRFDSGLVRTGATSLVESILVNLSLCFPEGDVHLIAAVIFHSAVFLLRLSAYFKNKDGDLLLNLALYGSIVYRLFVIGDVLNQLKHKMAGNCDRIAVPLVLFTLFSILPFSNSFIIYGMDTARFATSSVIVCMAYGQFKLDRQKPKRFIPLVLMLVCLRSGTLSSKCREELPECEDGVFSEEIGRLSHDADKVVRLLLGGLFLLWCGMRINNASNNFVSLTRAALRVMLFITFFHWLCEFEHDEKLKIYGLYSAQLVLAMCLLIFFATVLFAPRDDCLGLLMDLFIILMAVLGGDGVLVQLLAAREFLIQFRYFFITNEPIVSALVITMLNWVLFYSTGHIPTFSAIPFRAAFVFVSGEVLLRTLQGLFVILHLFCGHFLTALYVAGNQTDNHDVAPFFLLLSTIQVAFSCWATIFHRKHLMMYKVFAPYFLFTAAGLIVSITVILLSRLVFANKNKHA
ncbi:unnamed protein product [Bursaphelenchus xylophilus]|uniref:(pine wood nematode) hypothetical protein n=1 Tax=Bursaphelenchus xylophilus TaxID=6326 RepID=A0A7I8XI05_BURXY|nr:unnamed protein product [Bursaphelenchus xylophilus]CAG9085099.1 unnamed protein product [Bursaphelenchus xylophilus]